MHLKDFTIDASLYSCIGDIHPAEHDWRDDVVFGVGWWWGRGGIGLHSVYCVLDIMIQATVFVSKVTV